MEKSPETRVYSLVPYLAATIYPGRGRWFFPANTQDFRTFCCFGEKCLERCVIFLSPNRGLITPGILITSKGGVAFMATMRVTGPVLDSTRRKGIAKGSGNPYDFTQITVIVGGRGTVELTLPEDPKVIGGSYPDRFEVVDFVVEVKPRATGFGIDVLGLYSSTALAELAELASA